MGESRQQHSRIDGAARSFEDTANRHHADHAIGTHEAVFEKPPFAIPADQARVNLESLEYPEIVTKLGDRIAYYGKRFLPSGNPEDAGTHKPVDAANVGECKISAVVGVKVQVQVVWPDAQTNTRSGEQIDFGFAN